MKIILLCGNKSNQLALAAKVAKDFELIGIVKEERPGKAKLTATTLFSKIIDRLLFSKIAGSWYDLLSYYKKNYREPDHPAKLNTTYINAPEVVQFIERLKPDLIMVSGTSLIKKQLLELKPPKGIINLHTGLSPYVKGGPNCTNWCIANNNLHLIGNTIMWIDQGIDSGNIITSETVPYMGNESLNSLHLKVMEHAHHLYLQALHCVENNFANCPSVKQADIGKGELYLTKMWNIKAKLRFIRHCATLEKRLQAAAQLKQKTNLDLKMVKLPATASNPALYDRN